jgi:hypothetical protein
VSVDTDYLLSTETTTIDETTFYPSERAAFVEGDLDPFTGHSVGAGRWGSPSDPPTELDPGAMLPAGYDYSAGMLVGAPDRDDDAMPGQWHPHLIGLHTVGIPPGIYRVPHEATHRRYEPPIQVPVAQAAAGFTLIAPPTKGLHFVKVLGCFLMLSAAGTIKFVQGDSGGISTADMSGAATFVGNGGLVLPVADIANPWLFTSPDQALGIFTTGSPAAGWVLVCNSPYDS